MTPIANYRVTYITNEEETPCEETECGDRAQQACDFHFDNLNEEHCPDRQIFPEQTLCEPYYEEYAEGEPCLALSDSENHCPCRCDGRRRQALFRNGSGTGTFDQERHSPPRHQTSPGVPNLHMNTQGRHIDLSVATYKLTECAVFMRSREQYGRLSNMTPGYPLEINGLRFQGPEGLYQALKFPEEPKLQEQIGKSNSGMEAKKLAYQNPGIRSDWDQVRIHGMLYTVSIKLAQHPRWATALEETTDKSIVEMSFRDNFWGANPNDPQTTLTGRNILGKILTALRTELRHEAENRRKRPDLSPPTCRCNS